MAIAEAREARETGEQQLEEERQIETKPTEKAAEQTRETQPETPAEKPVTQKTEDRPSPTVKSNENSDGQNTQYTGKPPVGDLEYRLPGAIIIGWSKCGTRALLDFMEAHPDVCAAPHEVDYFNRNYEKGITWYKHQMRETYANQLAIEKSPEYVHDEETPAKIYAINKTMKIILLLCNPVRRAISEYVQSMSSREPDEVVPFESLALTEDKKEINADYFTIKRGVFANYMKPWIDTFPLNNILIIDGDKLRDNPFDAVKKTESFLGLEEYFTERIFFFDKEKGFYCFLKELDGDPKCLGESKGRPHPEVDPKVLQMLQDFFKPHNEDLFKMINLRFNW